MNKEQLKEQICAALHGVAPTEATPQQLHAALGAAVMQALQADWSKSTQAHRTQRHACYFSMEFLVGRAVFNNLLCLGIYEEAEQAFAELGVIWKKLKTQRWATAVWADWLPASWIVLPL